MIKHNRNIKEIAIHSLAKDWRGQPIRVHLSEVEVTGEPRVNKMLTCSCALFSWYAPCAHVKAAYTCVRMESQTPEDKLRNAMQFVFDVDPTWDVLVPLGVGNLVLRLRPEHVDGSPFMTFTIIAEVHDEQETRQFELQLYEEFTRDDFFGNLLRAAAEAFVVEASLGSTNPDEKPGRACEAPAHVERGFPPVSTDSWGDVRVAKVGEYMTLATRKMCLGCYWDAGLDEELQPY
jgi:hypothetical protein